jgi:epoxyqueuosine reductase
MDPKELRTALGVQVANERFDAFGVAQVKPLLRDQAAFDRWLHNGYQASMSYMEKCRPARNDPGVLLPGCRSVIVMALNYGPGLDSCAQRSDGAPVARYARGRDYHKVMGKALKRIAAWLEEQSGQAARSFVDTGPVLERAWAEQAGLGWIGKNANLIRRDIGSWMLLGEILSAAEIEPDPLPHRSYCGSCSACIEDCPTGAIVAPGEVDSSLCISYWTIEHRGSVPIPMRE